LEITQLVWALWREDGKTRWEWAKVREGEEKWEK
jgi:hypothetical protein